MLKGDEMLARNAFVTVTVITVDLPALLASPLYIAAIEWVPAILAGRQPGCLTHPKADYQSAARCHLAPQNYFVAFS
jgi:hypothetical protein